MSLLDFGPKFDFSGEGKREIRVQKKSNGRAYFDAGSL